MSKFFMGVDPGMSGAAAFINEDGQFVCFLDYPGSASALVNDLNYSCPPTFPLDDYIALAVIEHVHVMPKQGIVSSGKFMMNFGIWQGVLAAKNIPHELITPQRWRRILDSSVPLKPTKDDLRAYAIKRWPTAADDLKRKKDHNRSEALIMAEFARLNFLGQTK